ncbi:hypothetical protein Sjap_022164 [Stephania japonica]|uniref:Secreted protein n=1 Tax=Stephania japonica TaxID=461633 RepID=A0AAP0ERH2_9MAGN
MQRKSCFVASLMLVLVFACMCVFFFCRALNEIGEEVGSYFVNQLSKHAIEYFFLVFCVKTTVEKKKKKQKQRLIICLKSPCLHPFSCLPSILLFVHRLLQLCSLVVSSTLLHRWSAAGARGLA